MEDVQYLLRPKASKLWDDGSTILSYGRAIRARYYSRAHSDVCHDPASTYLSYILSVQRLACSAHSFATARRNMDFLSASHLKSSLSHSISASILSQVVLNQPTSFSTRHLMAYRHAVRSSICGEHLSLAINRDGGAGLTEEDREAQVARARSVQNPLTFGTRACRWCDISAKGSVLSRFFWDSSIKRNGDRIMLRLLAERGILKRPQIVRFKKSADDYHILLSDRGLFWM